jgi:hypothetical protein
MGVVDVIEDNSGDFWVKFDHFSTFWCFSVKSANAEYVSKVVTIVLGADDEFASSAQLKLSEMSGSGGFWVRIGEFSNFWSFLMKLADSERILKAVPTEVGSVNPVGGWDSKTTRNSALFWCSVGYGVGDELAVVEKVGAFGDCKIASLAVGGLV